MSVFLALRGANTEDSATTLTLAHPITRTDHSRAPSQAATARSRHRDSNHNNYIEQYNYL
ncbi:hypothetical protein V1478_009716 [Vespula squamosa]|uniref:Uncharacterized protein n=1 Tax=Vespula squamosa TaxID=30214 RepID=A0ABD2AQF5_VESSQ